MKVSRLILLALCAGSVSACTILSPSSNIPTRDKNVAAAKSIPALRIPPGMTSDQFQATYPVSDRNDPDSAKTISLVPPGA